MTDVKETDGAILARMGTDAQKWAREFLALDVDPDNLDEGMMIGWFANAIEAGRSAGQSTRSPTPLDEVASVEAAAEAGHLFMNPTLPWAGVHENGKALWRGTAKAMLAASPNPGPGPVASRGVSEARSLWHDMAMRGVAIGGEFIAVQVADMNALFRALAASPPVQGVSEDVARALCRVTGHDPDAIGIDGKPRWRGWVQYADAALAASPPAQPAQDEVVKALVDFVQTPDWQPDAVEPEDNADWRDGYEAAQENLREVLKPWWPLGGPFSIAASPPAQPAQDEVRCPTCGLSRSHPEGEFCSDGFHLPAQDEVVRALVEAVRMNAERLSVEAQLNDDSLTGGSLRRKMGFVASELFAALAKAQGLTDTQGKE